MQIFLYMAAPRQIALICMISRQLSYTNSAAERTGVEACAVVIACHCF